MADQSLRVRFLMRLTKLQFTGLPDNDIQRRVPRLQQKRSPTEIAPPHAEQNILPLRQFNYNKHSQQTAPSQR